MRAVVIFCLLAVSVTASQIDTKTEWWQTMSLYQIYPRSYKDSDGDGIGDLKGIKKKLSHMKLSHIDAFWLSPFYVSPMVDFGYDISDYYRIDPVYGTMKDFEDLVRLAHAMGLKVILDFIPNHTSDQHEWFQKSLKNITPYSDYYVWNQGKIVNGTRVPPSNWLSMFGGTAWTWRDERQAFYLHQYSKEQPDLNYYNKEVRKDMQNVMRFWLDKGIDGFRMDAVYHIVEDDQFRDEPPSGITKDPNNYYFTLKSRTQDQPGTYDVVGEWRKVLDEYGDKVMMLECYSNSTMTMKYYEAGAHFPFNFALITDLNKESKAIDFKNMIDQWMSLMPAGHTANWVAGNHDNSRLASRFGDNSRAVTLMTLLLPGVGVTYNGEEIGMTDTPISWEDTVDSQGCDAGEKNYASMSRDPERTPFQWNAGVSAGFSTNPKPWLPVNPNYKTVNLARERIHSGSYYDFYRAIAKLKKSIAVKKGRLVTKLLNKNVLAFSRETENHGSVYAIMNLGSKTEMVDLSAFDNIPKRLSLYYATTATGSISRLQPLLGDIKKLTVPASGVMVYVHHLKY